MGRELRRKEAKRNGKNVRDIQKLSKEKPLFSFFLSKKADSGKDTVTEEEKKAVYEIIIKERYWLKYPSIPFEIEKDYYYLLH